MSKLYLSCTCQGHFFFAMVPKLVFAFSYECLVSRQLACWTCKHGKLLTSEQNLIIQDGCLEQSVFIHFTFNVPDLVVNKNGSCGILLTKFVNCKINGT